MSSLTITIIQTALIWEDKEANLVMLSNKIDSITEPRQLIILPEMFNTGFTMEAKQYAEKMDGPTMSWMKETAAKKKVILTGSLIIQENGKFYNRLVWMLPNGQFGSYDKRHRFAFAGEDLHFTAGDKRLVASVNGWRVNCQICYDLRFPVWARQHSTMEDKLEYDLLIYVANWPAKRSLAWKTLLQARAIENQSFVCGVNRVGVDGKGHLHSGDSMLIAPAGDIMYHCVDQEDVHTITIEKTQLENVRSTMPFWKDADPFMIFNTNQD